MMRARIGWAASLALGVSAAGCPKQDGSTGAAADAPGVPALPPLVTPLDDAVAFPPLTGPTHRLDLETMLRTRIALQLEVDAGWMVDLTDDELAAIARAAEADPRLRVTEEAGVPVAWLRAEGPRGWSVRRGGHHQPAEAEAWRAQLRFAPWPDGAPWAESDRTVTVSADESAFAVDTWTMAVDPWRGATASALSLEAEGLWVDLLEVGGGSRRERTTDALGVLDRLVTEARYGLDRPPPGEPAPPSAPAFTPLGDGLLDARVRLAVPTRGWTWLRVLRDGAPWAEEAVGAGTRERIGAGLDPGRGALLQGTFPVPGGEAFPATVEAWHLADGAEAAALVGRWTVTVPAR